MTTPKPETTVRELGRHYRSCAKCHQSTLKDPCDKCGHSPDASILYRIEERELFNVHDIRQALSMTKQGTQDWILHEEISEEAERIIKRCSRRGWIRHRLTYPGNWQITSRFYLEAKP